MPTLRRQVHNDRPVMRVLHVIDKLSMDGINPSSCTVLFGGWAGPWKDHSCEIEVLSLSNDRQVAGYLESRGVPTAFAGRSKLSPGNIGEIRRRVIEQDFDLVHLHGYGAAHFGRLAARQAAVPAVVHEHAVLKIKPQHYLADRLLRNATDAAVAVSDYVREFMVEARSIPPNLIRVIGNGVDLTRFRPLTRKEQDAARQSLNIDSGARIIGTVTRLREEKGNEFLIKALVDIRSECDDATLVIVGDGPDKEKLQHLARDLGIYDAIHWLGFRKDVERIMPIFDVHVIPSLTEGYPLALAEGMAVENTMVVTEVGGMREIGRDSDNVLFVPPSSGPDIAHACLKILNNRDIATAIAESGARTAREMGIGTSASRILELYRELLVSR